MKTIISTVTLQSMVSKAMKGASCNRMIPITNLMAIDLSDGILTLTTSDATNYLYVSESVEENSDSIYVVVPAELFSKLISRLTCDYVTLEIENGNLTVTGNGKYSIELPIDEDGEPVKYPNPLKNFERLSCDKINFSTVKLMLNTASASIATAIDIPCYTGYYIGNRIITTDTCQICCINNKIFDVPVLLSYDMVNLLNVITEENIEVYRNDDTIVFDANGITVYGKVMNCIDDFQIDAINALIDEKFNSYCKLPKSALVNLLDRLSLFVGVYDKNGIYLTFTNTGVMITSRRANSSELIEYMESSNFTEFTCCVDIEMLRSQIKANNEDIIELYYGLDNAIKISDGNITQIIALMEDER